MVSSLCRLHVLNVFGVRPGYDMDTSHVFPHGVLVTITFIVGVLCVEGVLPTQDFLSAQWVLLPYQGWGLFSCC